MLYMKLNSQQLQLCKPPGALREEGGLVQEVRVALPFVGASVVGRLTQPSQDADLLNVMGYKLSLHNQKVLDVSAPVANQ